MRHQQVDEAAAVDPASGDVLLVSKKRVPPEVFRVPLRPAGDEVVVAEKLGTIGGIAQPSEDDLARNPVYGRYRAQVTAADLSANGRVLAVLADRGLDSSTIVVLAGDHGEGLGEHDETLHGFFAYQTTLAVPLVFRGPGIRPNYRIDETAGLVDLLPTVLDLLRVATPEELKPAGASLASALGGGAGPASRPQYAESLVPLLHFGWSDLHSLIEANDHYIHAPIPELYDIVADPEEKKNTYGENRRASFRMRNAITPLVKAASAPTQIDPEEAAKLAALGFRVKEMLGGLDWWQKEGFPVEKGAAPLAVRAVRA